MSISEGVAPATIDRSEAERFLKLLDPSATYFTFQTFDDNPERKKARKAEANRLGKKPYDPYAKVLNGTLDQHWRTLVALNDQGAGVFVTINETDGKGREIENIERIRSVFVDLDGAPLAPVMEASPAVHFAVETSPGHFHPYWRVEDVALGEFTPLQKALIERFGGDKMVHDLPRVMRLPGFLHRKAEPSPVRVVYSNGGTPYRASDFPTNGMSDSEMASLSDKHGGAGAPPEEKSPTQLLNDKALANLAAWVPAMFPGAGRDKRGSYRVSSAMLEHLKWRDANLEEDLSLHPKGIKDFGIATDDSGNIADDREGKRTPIDVVMEYSDPAKTFDEAVEWLRGKLGIESPSIVPEVAEPKATADVVEPVDLWDKFEAPELPSGVLPEVIERFAREEAATMGADPAGLAIAALVSCATAIPDRIKIKPKKHEDWKEAARLWGALIGLPSTKKSPIIAKATRPIKKIDGELYRKYRQELEEWEGLSKEEKQNTPKPRKTRLRIEDTTVEAAQAVMRDSPDGVLVLRDELSGWFGAMDKYSGHRGAAMDRGFWLQAWNGGPYALDRVGREGGVFEVSACILGGIQPDPMRKIAADTVDDGLLQRLLVVMLRPATMGKDEPVSGAVERYEKLVERLYMMKEPRLVPIISIQVGMGTYELDDGARAIRQQLEQKHLDLMAFETINRKLAAHIGKYDGIFARFCLIWHCIEHDNPPKCVSEETARRVADFLHGFLLPHALAFYASLGLADDQERLEAVAGYILAHRLEKATCRDIQKGVHSLRKLERRDTEALFEQLDALGWVRQTRGRRPSDPPQWLVNPEVHRLFAKRAAAEVERRARVRKLIEQTVRQRRSARRSTDDFDPEA
jgi:hypothetical protein